MKNAIICCKINFCQWKGNWRIRCSFLLSFGFIFSITNPICTISKSIGISCTPWLFPFITSNTSCTLVLMLLLLVLLCDAPFLFEHQLNVIIRAGRRSWISGQILYIVLATFLFWLSIYLFSVITLMPNILFSLEWGKLLNTIAQTRLGSTVGSISINYSVMLDFSPIVATLISFMLAWLVSSFVGVVILFFNMSRYKWLGTVFAVLLILLQNFAHLASGYWAYTISPVSWISIEILNFAERKTRMPSFHFAITSVVFLIIVHIVMIYRKMRTYSIDLLSR